MRKIALILAFVSLSSCISVHVNSNDNLDKVFKNVINSNVSSTGTFLDFVHKDDSWSNQNSFNSTQANFKNSVGKSYIKLVVKKKIDLQFYHKVKLNGDLNFEISSAKDEVIYTKSLSNDITENFELNLKAGEYKIIWKADNASGSYYLEWKEKS